MSPQFGKRNVSKKHQLFSKEIELSGWYILPLKTDPCAHYCRSFFSSFLAILILNMGFAWSSLFFNIFEVFDNSDQQCGIWMAINMDNDDSSWDLHRNTFVAIFSLFSKNGSMLRLLRPFISVESKNGLISVQYPICVSCCLHHVR